MATNEHPKLQVAIYKILMVGMLIIIQSGCVSTPTETFVAESSGELQPDAIKDVRVEKSQATKITVDTEEFNLPNCGGTTELSQTLGTQASVQRGVTIGGKARLITGVEVGLPSAAKAKIEGEVELAYEQEYQSASSRVDSIRMAAAGGSHVIYDIEWEEQEFVSDVSFTANGMVHRTPYTYTLTVPKIANSRQINCYTVIQTENQTPEPPTITPSQSELPAPKIYNFSACLNPCTGSNATRNFPEKTKKIYALWNYENIPIGSHYVRAWNMDGREWVRYDCIWYGPETGVSTVELKEPDGLHSGTWEVTISVDDKVLLREQIIVEGNWDYWYPAGIIDKCFGTVPNQPGATVPNP